MPGVREEGRSDHRDRKNGNAVKPRQILSYSPCPVPEPNSVEQDRLNLSTSCYWYSAAM